ncbi:MAG: DUF420 domain-containing protein [candidate division KSB1 bacterium]|nr:DUF420 domain-containing protein [candidate division KSB1 bacterium]MDZ7301547.1 DUF420 domain-containing protein [candidate division KSB1 bacterium]MDZ7311037.1 DUF420 domain-containing protein [candidate division KSB1 bacterium]
MIQFADLPTVNAMLNSLSAIFLATGYYFIKTKKIAAHRISMFAALATSALFFLSYLIYHYHAGSKRFAGQGTIRMIYFTILISHTILAAAIVPLVLITLVRALRERFDQHKRLARWTLPLWFYVSVTGVIIYWMLYQI